MVFFPIAVIFATGGQLRRDGVGHMTRLRSTAGQKRGVQTWAGCTDIRRATSDNSSPALEERQRTFMFENTLPKNVNTTGAICLTRFH